MQNKTTYLLDIQSRRATALTWSIMVTRLMAGAIVASIMIVGYASSAGGSVIYLTLLTLVLLQVFETRAYERLIIVRRLQRSLGGGLYPDDPQRHLLAAAGLAAAHTYLPLLLCADVGWLFNCYLRPVPAPEMSVFVSRLAIGSITGEAFVVITFALWIGYGLLACVGVAMRSEIEDPQPATLAGSLPDETSPGRSPFVVSMTAADGTTLRLRGYRMRRADAQPLILWPGFFQNGYVYDLIPGETSLAEFLWREGFDLWIIHSRGTGGSDGSSSDAALDDYAAIDIPAVIDHVAARTAIPPIYVGHSQGGITAIMSMMGAARTRAGTIELSDTAAAYRQGRLRGLVTLGSYLDFRFERHSDLHEFAQNGLGISIFGRRIRLFGARGILGLLTPFRYIALPLHPLRQAMLAGRALRVFLAPIYLVLRFAGTLRLWEFLYHIDNIERREREHLFFRTIDGTFHRILGQFLGAVETKQMRSLDGRIDYSAAYDRLTLPVSFVAMEYDSLAHPGPMQSRMFGAVSSDNRHFTEWKGIGHEDQFMSARYFPGVLEAIRKVQ